MAPRLKIVYGFSVCVIRSTQEGLTLVRSAVSLGNVASNCSFDPRKVAQTIGGASGILGEISRELRFRDDPQFLGRRNDYEKQDWRAFGRDCGYRDDRGANRPCNCLHAPVAGWR